MATRQELLDEVTTLAGGLVGERGVRSFDLHAATALRTFSAHAKPRIVVLAVTGDGGDEYGLGADWVDGFSVIHRLRYVASGDYDAVPVYWTDSDYQLETDSSGNPQIRFRISPGSTDIVVIEHTAPYTLGETAATTTVPDYQLTALAYLVAANALRAAAVGVTATRDQGTDTDILDFNSQGGEFRRLADDYDAQFDDLMGIDRASPGAPTKPPVITTTRAQPNRRRSRYLTHPARGPAVY